MELLFLDGAARMGFAYGPPGVCPTSGSVQVWDKVEPIEIACGRAARWLVAHIKRRRPDLIGIEHPQSSGGLRSGRGNARSTDSQLMINGALHGVAGVYGIQCAAPYPQQIRKAVCGRASPPVTSGEEVKPWVARHLVMFGMLPKDFALDHDRSDAVAGHCYVSAFYGKAPPPLVLRA